MKALVITVGVGTSKDKEVAAKDLAHGIRPIIKEDYELLYGEIKKFLLK